MDLTKMISIQNEFDKKHGWSLKSDELSELLNWLHKDLVGLLGELGEFANHLKKITLVHEKPDIEKSAKLLEELKENLSEELIDSLIYIMRIASHLGVDIESEYLKKLNFNKSKYKEYEL
jgi:NTP pyrophosphatase (non-canonical NTP hydrolase)